MNKRYKELIEIFDDIVPYIRGAADSYLDNKEVQEDAQTCLDTYYKILEIINYDLEKEKYETNAKTNTSWRFSKFDDLLEDLNDFDLIDGVEPLSIDEEVIEDLQYLKNEFIGDVNNLINTIIDLEEED